MNNNYQHTKKVYLKILKTIFTNIIYRTSILPRSQNYLKNIGGSFLNIFIVKCQ